mgnify:FL=1
MLRFGRLLAALAVLGVFFLGVSSVSAEEKPFRYNEAQYDGAQLRYFGNIPVLTLSGSPEEIGQQQGKLGAAVAEGILSYPKDLFQMVGREQGWIAHLETAKKMQAQFPPHHLAE